MIYVLPLIDIVTEVLRVVFFHLKLFRLISKGYMISIKKIIFFYLSSSDLPRGTGL